MEKLKTIIWMALMALFATLAPLILWEDWKEAKWIELFLDAMVIWIILEWMFWKVKGDS